MRAAAVKRRRSSRSQEPAPPPPPGRAGVRLVRQPLFGADEESVGYRLLSEDSSGLPGGFLDVMPQGGDAQIVLGYELHAIAPRGLVILSVSRRELLAQTALSLPSDRVILCLGAEEPLDEELQDAVDRHAMRGFRLAVDAGERAALDGPLLDRADMIIVEPGARSPAQLSRLAALPDERARPLQVMAAGVDSRRSFEVYRRLGFHLFQGHFFLRRSAGPASGVDEAGLGGIGTMADLSSTDSFEGLAEIITRDPGLSMRLLRYANSAHVALPRPVGSVHEALAWLGAVAVREFALVAALAQVPDAPGEVLVTALTRARTCQQVSRRLPGANSEESFTVGLFSVAEAVANAPIESIVGELPLREDVASAVIRGDGELGRLLEAVIAYERGDFASATALTPAPGSLAESYIDSVSWAGSVIKAVS